MDDRMRSSLDAVFRPRSVAIVGASNSPKRWGYQTLENMVIAGYRGAIYPVNPAEKEVQGFHCYPSLSAIPGEVDLAVIVVNASLIRQVVGECIEKGVKGGIVITAGFAELGHEGALVQQWLAAEAERSGFYFIGPNCWGVWSSDGGVNTIFGADMIPPKGHVAFVSQSGTLAEYFHGATKRCGFGVSRLVSCGNQASITFTDLIEYMGDDPLTRVITGYMEDMRDGRRFFEVARRVSAKKPLLIYKAGSSAAAARAARSHTAAMAADNDIFEAACRQAGVILRDDFFEMWNIADALCHQPLPGGNRGGILSMGGGFCVTAAESCSRKGLEIPELNLDVQNEIRAEMLPFSPLPVNPVDCIGRKNEEAYLRIIDIVARQESIDGLIVTPRLGNFDRRTRPDTMVRFLQSAAAIAALPEKYGKPLILASEHELSGPVYETLKRNHIPFFENPMDCAKAMQGLVEYAAIRRR